MNTILDWLNKNDWSIFVFLILAILGIILSIIFYIKSRKVRKPLYQTRSINVFTSEVRNHGDIEIRYNGDKIDNFTVTKVGFWNGGSDTLDSSDQAKTNLLRVSIDKEYIILNAEVVFQSETTNNTTLKIENNEVFIDFDYFDPNQGCVIKINHTGTKSSNIKLNGTFKGSKSIEETNDIFFIIYPSVLNSMIPFFNLSKMSKQVQIKIQRQFPWVMLVVSIAFIVIPLVFKLGRDAYIVGITIGIIYGVFSIYQLLVNKRMPKGFEILLNDE